MMFGDNMFYVLTLFVRGMIAYYHYLINRDMKT